MSLNKPISHYIPDFNGSWGKHVKLDQLLSHTSGINSYTDDLTLIRRKYFKKHDLIEYIRNIDQKNSLVDTFNYSNTNYYIVGLIIEKLYGMSASHALMKTIFLPLKMERTELPEILTFDELIKEKGIKNAAPGYVLDLTSNEPSSNLVELSKYEPPEISYIAGGIVSTASDLKKWFLEIFKNNKIIPKDIVDVSTVKRNKVREERNQVVWYGYGIGGYDNQDARINNYSHGGSIPGYSSKIYYYHNIDTLLIFLSNTSGTHDSYRDDLEELMSDKPGANEKEVDVYFEGKYPGYIQRRESISPNVTGVFEKYVTENNQQD